MVGNWQLINKIWEIVSFLFIVLQLLIIRGYQAGIIYVFVLPVVVAFFVSRSDAKEGTRMVARWFMTCVCFGLFISASPRICPDLGGVDRSLTPEQDAALAWYSIVYIAFLVVIVPIQTFRTNLKNHREGLPASLSRPICKLGLVATVLVAPIMISTMLSVMHFWPLYR